MNAVFGCPACGRAVDLDAGEEGHCRQCGAAVSLPAAERLDGCLVCDGAELYRHRDFNLKLGIVLIAAGAGLSLWLTSFIPLAAAALIDGILYFVIPDVAICYRCKAHYRDLDNIEDFPAFDLERFEHYRWTKAREEGRIAPNAPNAPKENKDA